MIKKHKKKIAPKAEREEKSPLILMVFLRRFYKPLAAVAGAVIFFLMYNIYIVDRSMLDIQFALEQTAQAESLNDIQGLDMILSSLVLKEVANKKSESEDVINLDFAAAITQKAKVLVQTKDAKMLLSDVLRKKKQRRSQVLIALDGLNEKVVKTTEGIMTAFSRIKPEEITARGPDEKLIQAAQDFQGKGELENAIKAYETALRQIPRYQGAAKVRLAYLYQKTGNFNRANMLYGEILENAPGTQAGGFAKRLLDDLKEKRRLAQKKNSLEKSISTELSMEKLQDSYYELAAVKSLLGDFEGANQAYHKTMELGPQTDTGQKARFNLAFNYKIEGKYSESEKIFEQLSREFPQGRLAADANYWTAESLNKQGKYEEALNKFQEVAERFKDKPMASMALFRAAYSCLYDLKDPQRAKMFFERLKGEFSEAEAAKYAMIEPASRISNIYRDGGFKLLLEGKIEEATINFGEALKLDPVDARSYSGLGSAKGLMQYWQEAMEKAKKAVELAPQDGYTNANLGFLYILQNDYEEAVKFYEKAVEYVPKYAEAQYNLGWLYQNKGKFDKATEAYKNSIAYKPDLAAAHNNLGTCYWRFDRYNEAFEEFKLAAQLEPNLPEAHYNLGVAHFTLGRFRQAQAELEKTLAFTDKFEDTQKVLDAVKRKVQEGKE